MTATRPSPSHPWKAAPFKPTVVPAPGAAERPTYRNEAAYKRGAQAAVVFADPLCPWGDATEEERRQRRIWIQGFWDAKREQRR